MSVGDVRCPMPPNICSDVISRIQGLRKRPPSEAGNRVLGHFGLWGRFIIPALAFFQCLRGDIQLFFFSNF